MYIKIKDKGYLEVVKHILKDRKFKNIAKFSHHGTTRFEHSIRVSYFSYKIARRLGLDYMAAAKSGLLHDFFEDVKKGGFIEGVKHNVCHPITAAENAVKRFKITEKEKEIIQTHMFPLTLKPSRYLEGWIVSLVDKTVGTYEYGVKFKYQFTLWAVFLLNFMRS